MSESDNVGHEADAKPDSPAPTAGEAATDGQHETRADRPGGPAAPAGSTKADVKITSSDGGSHREVEADDPDLARHASDSDRPDRAGVIGDGVRWMASWALRISIILLFLWILKQALGPLWIAILPILLGMIFATVLWPPARWLRSKGFAPALAAATSLIGGLVVLGGAITLLTSSVFAQAPELAKQASTGVRQVQTWLEGPPFNLEERDISKAVEQVTGKLTESATQIAGGVVGGILSTVQVFVTIFLALLLAFFFIKDGTRFAPWVTRVVGEATGGHMTEIFTRMWNTLGGYVRGQALVSLVDAVFIGAGLAVLGVPLWLPLAAITFFAGFIPIVGATVAGALAVLIALVSKSVTTALLVLLLVIIVQQIEGNILQPLIQSKSMNLHAGLVILSVTVGGHMYGIIGAFLAVPATALLLVLLRYLQEQVDLRSGTSTPDDLEYATAQGRRTAEITQEHHARA